MRSGEEWSGEGAGKIGEEGSGEGAGKSGEEGSSEGKSGDKGTGGMKRIGIGGTRVANAGVDKPASMRFVLL